MKYLLILVTTILLTGCFGLAFGPPGKYNIKHIQPSVDNGVLILGVNRNPKGCGSSSVQITHVDGHYTRNSLFGVKKIRVLPGLHQFSLECNVSYISNLDSRLNKIWNCWDSEGWQKINIEVKQNYTYEIECTKDKPIIRELKL